MSIESNRENQLGCYRATWLVVPAVQVVQLGEQLPGNLQTLKTQRPSAYNGYKLQVEDMQGQSMAGMLGLALPSNGFDLEGRWVKIRNASYMVVNRIVATRFACVCASTTNKLPNRTKVYGIRMYTAITGNNERYKTWEQKPFSNASCIFTLHLHVLSSSWLRLRLRVMLASLRFPTNSLRQWLTTSLTWQRFAHCQRFWGLTYKQKCWLAARSALFFRMT